LRHFAVFFVFFILALLITPGSAKALTIRLVSDSDSLKAKSIPKDSLHLKKKKAVLDSKVDYHAKDSIRLDAVNRKVYLYGDASVKYQDLELKAAYIDISLDSNIAVAHGVENKDSGKVIGKPEFHQGSDVFNADVIRYNFKSKKGRIDEIYTKEGDGYIHGKIVKKDTNSVFYLKGGRYSTCSLEYDPHFYIIATKLKVIPHDEIVTGPALLVIEGVPTPLAIPFGFFPLTNGRRSGILIPTYGESQSQGFFLQNGGYYLGLSDHLDLQLRGDIYSNLSWAERDIISYKDRYHYNGTFSFAYSDTRLPIPESSDLSTTHAYFITWQHTQDPKANPNTTFSASVNAGSSQYMTLNSYNPAAFLQNTFQSNIAFATTLMQTPVPLHLSLNAEHSQNTLNHSLTISLPELTLTADRTYPFKFIYENPASDQWLEKGLNKISVGFTLNAKNTINTFDTVAFNSSRLLKQMQNGVSSSIPINASYQVLKYVTITPAINISDVTYFQTIHKSNFQSSADSVKTDTVQGIKSAMTFNGSITMSTTFYSKYSLGKKAKPWLIFRHVMFPSIGFSYSPEYSAPGYGYYSSIIYDNKGDQQRYSIFQNGIYSGPGLGKTGALNFGLGNNLEMKYRTNTDSGVVYKKIVLLERFNIGGSYNMAADSFKMSNITIAGNTTLFKKLGINFTAGIDPYYTNSLGTDINKLVWNDGQIGRLTSADLSFSTTLTGSTNKSGNDKTKTSSAPIQFSSPDQYLTYEQFHPLYYVPIEISPWSVSFFYNFVYSNLANVKQTTQSITTNASAQITKFWYFSIYSGYDLQAKQFTTTSLSVKRDMHCWELTFTTIPFGFHQSFQLEVHVKSSVLQDLKLTRRRDWTDTQQYGE
jgi:lipopolysaccharide assembly outer membrane protein LptD (OstA)